MPKIPIQQILNRLRKIKNIVITEEVINYIAGLEAKPAEKIIRSLELLSENGFYLPKTYYHRISQSKYKLWELITSFGNNEYRSLFFSVEDGKFLISHAFMKTTNKVPEQDIKIAEKVYEDWITETKKKK